MGRESALRPRALIVVDEILIALGLKEEMRGWGCLPQRSSYGIEVARLASRRVRLAMLFSSQPILIPPGLLFAFRLRDFVGFLFLCLSSHRQKKVFHIFIGAAQGLSPQCYSVTSRSIWIIKRGDCLG